MVATVLTACGIETVQSIGVIKDSNRSVATVLTACGIETYISGEGSYFFYLLQQCLPLAVLKRSLFGRAAIAAFSSCNSAYRLRY